ncbi:MFS transporter [Ramlibacter sp. MAHUQ-53]|uniref:MFS transporter n=1 Tax=unclassified Ramlibacter TaxID=2617605 RepID=UPI00363DAA0D
MTTPTPEDDGGGLGLARLVLGQTFLHASMAGMRLAMPLLALREGHSAAAVGVLLAMFAITQVFLALPAGRYADRHGLKRPMALSVAAAVLGAGLAAAWPVFPVLCLGALLTGGATGAAVIALQRHVGRAASGALQLRQAFSWLSIGPAVSNFVGPFLAGLLIDHAGFRTAFVVMALFPLGCWFWVRRAREAPRAEAQAAARGGRAWDLLREPGFRRLMVVNWVLSSAWDVHTFIVPVLGHERDLSASVIGAILGAFAVAAALVRTSLPLIPSTVREWQVILAAMWGAAVAFALYPLMPSALAMGACSVLLGLALGAVQPMIMSTLHQITPEHRQGEALGLRLMAINASSVLMPMLFGAAGTLIGASGLFWTVGAVLAGGTRLASGLRHHDAGDHRP